VLLFGRVALSYQKEGQRKGKEREHRVEAQKYFRKPFKIIKEWNIIIKK
jgi:hypothetical protein